MDNGDYVRTKSYGIKKINGFSSTLEEDFIDCDYDKTTRVLINKKDIVKSSPNIIDLIEVGDFIGKTIVEEVKEFDDGTRVIVMADGFDEYDENEYFLKAGIVTKEQFESMEYKIGE